MLKQYGDLQAEFASLKAKYEQLVSRSFSDPALHLPDLEDTTLLDFSSSTRKTQFGTQLSGFSGRNLNLLTSATTSIGGGSLSSHLAVAEFMLRENLSSSINLLVNANWTGLRVEGGQPYTQDSDTHGLGAMPAALLYTRFYRALSATLHEFTSQLKSVPAGLNQTLFDRTVVAVTTDFNRLPRSNGGGADHGWEGSSYTVLSGMVPKLTVIGNVHHSTSDGTWGLAGSIPELGGRTANMGNVASTLCKMLEVPTPTPNDMSFVTKVNGKISPVLPRPKNIA